MFQFNPPQRLVATLAVMALAPWLASCGSDETSDTASESTPSTPAVSLPVSDESGTTSQKIATTDEATVYRCAAIQPDGKPGHIEQGGYHDITSHGLDCRDAHERVIATGKRYDGPKFEQSVDGFDCKAISVDGINVTIRCVNSDRDSYRFTRHTAVKPTSHPKPIVACGEFGNFYAISAHAVKCNTVEKLINAVDWSSGTTKAGNYRCTRLYTEGGHPTLRCVDGERSFRLTIDTRPAPSAPKKLTPPSVTHSCPHTDQWRAITAQGMTCDDVDGELTRHEKKLTATAPGNTAVLASKFSCVRIDDGAGQAPTVRCTRGAETFRASFIDSPEPNADDGEGALSEVTTTP